MRACPSQRLFRGPGGLHPRASPQPERGARVRPCGRPRSHHRGRGTGHRQNAWRTAAASRFRDIVLARGPSGETLRVLLAWKPLAVPKKRAAGNVPEPPWTYAPSEVAEWMASTAGPRRRGSASRRQARVKGFVGRSPTSAEQGLLRRLAGPGFEPDESVSHFPAILVHLPHAADSRSFRGNLGGTQVHVRLRKDAVLELRLAFVPRLSFRRASKFLSRLGLRGLEGTWT